MNKQILIAFTCGSLLTAAIVGSIAYYQIEQNKLTSKPWFEISPQVEEKLKNLHVSVYTKDLYSSGCKIMGGKAYLVPIHGVWKELLNNEPVIIDQKPVYEVLRSHTDFDYVVYSENRELKPEDVDLSFHNELNTNDFVIILGNPGDRPNYLQPAIIESYGSYGKGEAKNHLRRFTGQYVELGGSGGCAFSRDGNRLLGVVYAKDPRESTKSTVGNLITISAPIE